MRATVPVTSKALASGVVHCPALIDGDVLCLLTRYVEIRLSAGTVPTETGRPDCYALYGDAAIEALFELLVPRLDDILPASAEPSYGYLRVYRAGAELPAHRDRDVCEFTLSLGICGAGAGMEWPLHAHDLSGSVVSQAVRPGDGVLMRGREITHWREPLESGWAAYAFLHWTSDLQAVDKRFDGRPGLGFSRSG
jgi:hypothetical protein